MPGLLDMFPGSEEYLNQQGMMGLSQGFAQAGAPSRTPIGFAQAINMALQGQRQSQDSALDRLVKMKKIEAAIQQHSMDAEVKRMQVEKAKREISQEDDFRKAFQIAQANAQTKANEPKPMVEGAAPPPDFSTPEKRQQWLTDVEKLKTASPSDYAALMQQQREQREQPAQTTQNVSNLELAANILESQGRIQDAIKIREAINKSRPKFGHTVTYDNLGGFVTDDAAGVKYVTAGKRNDPNKPFNDDYTPNLDYQAYELNKAKNSANQVNVDTKQESAFASELGKGQAKSLLEGKQAALDASQILQTINEGEKLLNKGVITGFGANFRLGLGKALKLAGINYGTDDVSNTDAFTAAMAQNVGKVIKQFGSGTGLSDADREYATKMVGGSITITEESIRKILEMNKKAAINIINMHKQNVRGINTNIPLDVDMPKSNAETKVIVNRGVLPDGRKVILYSDGSSEYAK